MKLAQLFLTLCLPLFMVTETWGATYLELRKASVNYLIASLAIESIKKTECAYVFRSSKLASHSDVLSKVEKKLNSTDKNELWSQIASYQKQMDNDIKAQLHEFRLKTDEKTACGMLSSFAINKFLESQSDWHKKLSN